MRARNSHDDFVDRIMKTRRDVTDEDMRKPKFALYTGTESVEEKDIILNITNSTWENVPSTITDKLLEHHTNNHLGEIVKVFMI